MNAVPRGFSPGVAGSGWVCRCAGLRACGVAVVAAALVAAATGAEFRVTSPDVREGRAIPEKFTCKGANVSPALAWSGAPAGTKSFAVVCDDPDAPGGTWVHWVLYGLPAGARGVAGHVAASETLPDGARQGLNSFRKIGYGGPCPPPGERHRYVFTVFALDGVPALPPRATKADQQRAAAGHILAEAKLRATFGP